MHFAMTVKVFRPKKSNLTKPDNSVYFIEYCTTGISDLEPSIIHTSMSLREDRGTNAYRLIGIKYHSSSEVIRNFFDQEFPIIIGGFCKIFINIKSSFSLLKNGS